MSLTTPRAICEIISRFDNGFGAVLVEQRRLAAALARDNDLVGGGERFAAEPGVDQAVVGDAELDVILQEGIKHRVGNLVADLVRMTFGNRFTGEQEIIMRHRNILPRRAAAR